MLLERYLPRVDFDSYEDFYANFKLNVPGGFNFGFDIVDGWAEIDPDKPALLWCDDHGGEERFTFADISKASNRAANALRALGVGKGDVVIMILRRRYEYWMLAAALNKLGAVIVPASLQLTAKDIAYRVKAAGAKMLICVHDEFVLSQAEQAEASFESPVTRMTVAGGREGWLSYEDETAKQPDTFERPSGAEAAASSDLMLMYFTSGTTGMPKMVRHTFAHPLGHIITAKYWQRVEEGKLHMTVSDSGWAKFGWGKIYGQWICGAVVFAYDMDKYIPAKLLANMEKYKLTTFCAPPTMYRFMLQEDLTKYDLSSIRHCFNAGEPLNPEIYKRFYELTGLRLTEG
ncbi:MAG: AMP-binding protein, partial [Oscillospiraceae bacterium]|nr:AMP-binding protein [Oscillospiraceae bacterium]